MLRITEKNIFLIDGLGALLTAFLLIAVLRIYEKYFGMPSDILFILSAIACIFAIYSWSCFLFIDKISSKFLMPIIIANASYCLLTFSLIVYYFNRLTVLGIIYFLVEIITLCILIYFENKILKNKPLKV